LDVDESDDVDAGDEEAHDEGDDNLIFAGRNGGELI